MQGNGTTYFNYQLWAKITKIMKVKASPTYKLNKLYNCMLQVGKVFLVMIFLFFYKLNNTVRH